MFIGADKLLGSQLDRGKWILDPSIPFQPTTRSLAPHSSFLALGGFDGYVGLSQWAPEPAHHGTQ